MHSPRSCRRRRFPIFSATRLSLPFEAIEPQALTIIEQPPRTDADSDLSAEARPGRDQENDQDLILDRRDWRDTRQNLTSHRAGQAHDTRGRHAAHDRRH